ncbi:MAG TPA: ATP-binding protein [Bacillus sp. (in: firmicutes)]|nr:ATP-binding protein [Bacillus sp. (in: firmicutes)]
MRNYLRNLSVFNKTVLFSTFIVILVGLGTAYISYQTQRNAIQEVLSNQAVGTANLWKNTLSIEDIHMAEKAQSQSDPHIKRLKKSLQMINKDQSSYLRASILSAKQISGNRIKVLVTGNEHIEKKLGEKRRSKASSEFMSAYNRAITLKKPTYSQVYTNQFGTWITGYVPIMENRNEVAAVFIIDIDASLLTTYQRKLIASLVVGCIMLFTIIIFFQDWGLRKLMNPLKELLNGIQQVSRGNFQVRMRQIDKSEIGDISWQFNEMSKKLQILFDQVAATTEHFGEKVNPKEPLKGIEKAIDEMEMIIERTKLQKELQRAEKMNAIGQLAASVAHEIRNPMTVVKGFLQIFQQKESFSEDEKGYVQLMISEINRAEMIINDYLSLARPDMEHNEKIDCTACLTNLVELLSSYALLTNNIKIELDVGQKAYVKGSKNELNQVLLNIMKNGIEAMKDGGTLKVHLSTDLEFVHITIADTGIGMSHEELQRLGTPFYSLKEKGTGIGMMVSYQIIEKMKGKIEVASQKGEGTTFVISLPRVFIHPSDVHTID